MESAWQELIKQAPWAAAMLGLAWLLLRYFEKTHDKFIASAEKERQERVANATDKAKLEREHEIVINNLWANTIKDVFTKQENSAVNITNAISIMHKDMQEKYEAMGITQNLLDLARKELSRK
jgi:glutamate/tyrosine decarboxylase-like PLP-dependent enzyme